MKNTLSFHHPYLKKEKKKKEGTVLPPSFHSTKLALVIGNSAFSKYHLLVNPFIISFFILQNILVVVVSSILLLFLYLIE